MSNQTTTTVDSVLAQLPAEWHAPAREYLAAIAAATSETERAAIQQRVIDATVREARLRGWCSEAEAALSAAFGDEPADGWRSTDGYNCRGDRLPVYDADGYDQDGYNRDGYGRDGFHRHTDRDRDGYNRTGYGMDGFSREGRDRNGYDRDGRDRDGLDSAGYDANGLDKDGRSKYRFDVDGYDADGYGRDGRHRRTRRDRDGYDGDGYDATGYDRDGVNLYGYTREWLLPDGTNPFVYTMSGYTRESLQQALAERYPTETTAE